MKKLIMSSLAIAAAAFAFGAKPDAEGFVSIFNGKDLDGVGRVWRRDLHEQAQRRHGQRVSRACLPAR